MSYVQTLLLILVFTSNSGLAQNKVKLLGAAVNNPGANITVERFQDYFSRTMTVLAETKLKDDSTFALEFDVVEIEKLKVTINQDYCYIYVQPNSEYKLFISNKRTRNFNNPTGNELEASLLDLSKEDINYKILAFDLWYDKFMGDNYHLRTKRDSSFVKNLIQFESRVADYYSNDSCDFLRTYVKYRVASIEDLNFVGARSERARYAVNLAPFTVHYRSEEYMTYIKNFYKNYFESLAPELNQTVFKAIVAGSPTRMINALSKDYRVANVRLRELVMIMSLADIYHDKNYPQSRINVILDSISNHGKFKENQIIAKNTLSKLRQLKQGSIAPNYKFFDRTNQEYNLKSFQPKYTYIQFINSDQTNSLLQLEMLKSLYSKYNTSIGFITVVVNEYDWESISKKINLESVQWPVVIAENEKTTKEQFQLTVYPHYVLIDAQGYIVQSPAASPVPDGTYKTIDYFFFEIHKVMSRQNRN